MKSVTLNEFLTLIFAILIFLVYLPFQGVIIGALCVVAGVSGSVSVLERSLPFSQGWSRSSWAVGLWSGLESTILAIKFFTIGFTCDRQYSSPHSLSSLLSSSWRLGYTIGEYNILSGCSSPNPVRSWKMIWPRVQMSTAISCGLFLSTSGAHTRDTVKVIKFCLSCWLGNKWKAKSTKEVGGH